MMANFSVNHKWHYLPLLEYEFEWCRMNQESVGVMLCMFLCSDNLLRIDMNCEFLSGLLSLHALTFTQTPPSRISKSLGDNVMLKWTYSIAKPSELVRLECGYLNQSRQMTKLMEQFSTEFQPRTTVIGTRFVNRAYIENGALILTNLRAEDNGIYYCIMKVYDAVRFETVTIRSIDTYLSVGGKIDPTSLQFSTLK